MNRKIGWGLAILAAGGMGMVTWWWRGETEGSAVDVVVASSYLPVGTILQLDHLALKKTPKPYVQPGALIRKRDAVGQITVAQIAESEQVLANKISDSPPSVTASIPFGRRAYTLPLEASTGLGGLIKPGDMADVLATVEVADGQRDIVQTSTIVQNVRIIAVGSNFRPLESSGSKKSTPGMDRSWGEALTIAVTAQESELLAFAEQRGKLKIVARSAGDAEIGSSRVVNFQTLLRGPATPAAKPVSPGTQIIQGLDESDRRR